MRAAPAVAINGRAARRAEIGGVERVAREVVARLPRLRPGGYRVFSPPAGLAHRAGHLWEQALLPAAARRFGLLLSPANVAPLAARNNVVCVFDAAAVRHPEWYGAAYARWQRLLLRGLAGRARVLVTASSFGREELVEVLGADPGRVAVIPLGVDERFGPGADPEPVRRAYGLERPYVLAVGTRVVRKNLRVLQRAAAALSERGVELVVAGGGRGYMRGEPDAPGRALGYVAEEHLPGLYTGAGAVVVPSRYEGFGLPCLEAMASGTPVVAASATALPETCAGAAVLVEPDDGEGFADALTSVLDDEALNGRLCQAGIERASRFSWQRTAEELDRLLMAQATAATSTSLSV